MELQLARRLQIYLEPLAFLCVAFYCSFLVFIELLTFQINPSDVLSRDKFSGLVFGKWWLRMNKLLFDNEKETPTPALIASARGVVLELGPGSGNQLSRYSKSQITCIYGVEPNTALHPQLQANVKKYGLSDIYKIVPCGIEDFDRLRTYGLTEGSVDTVVSHQVLCGVPRPKEMVKACYQMLKPGGVMVVKEHVKATEDPVTIMIQRMYQTIWPFFIGGCNLTRSTGDDILEAGEWSKIDQVLTSREDPLLVIPPFAGRFTKAG